MSRWQDQFEAHRLRSQIAALEQFLSTFEAPADWSEWVPHIQLLLRRLSALLDLADPELTPISMLDSAAAQIDFILDRLSSLEQSDDPAVVRAQVEETTTRLTQELTTWREPPGSTAIIESELAAMRGQLEDADSRLTTIRVTTEDYVAGLRTQLDTLSETIKQAGTDLISRQDSLVADLQLKITELSETVDGQKSRLDTAIAEFQSQFSAAQELRSTAADEVRNAQQAAFDEAIRAANNTARAELEARNQDALKVLAQLDTLKGDAERTTEAIGMAGMAGGYKIDADKQKQTADRLRVLAIAFLVVTAFVAYLALITSHSAGGLDYKSFFAKLIVSATIGSLATYAIVQSAHHRERERQDRKLQIELASIDSYLALMPETQKYEIKAKLADAWFGQPLEAAAKAEGVEAIPAAQVVKLLFDALGK